MKNLKKVLSLVLALAMALSLMTTAFAADASDFKDYDKVTYGEAVDVMVAVGVFNGVEGNNFAPNTELTREQAAKIITYMIMGQKEADKLTTTVAPYADVAKDRWSAGAIAWCTEQGILTGYNGKFNPTGKLDGLAFSKMLLVALGYDAKIEKLEGSSWAINSATLAINADLDDGMEEISLSKVLTREEAAQMAFNAMKADLVAYENKGTNITLSDGTNVVIGATPAKEVTNASLASRNNIDSTGNVIQFAEKYATKLVLTHPTDAFERPTNEWKYDKVKVGAYAKAADLTYTASVKLGDIYKDLGLSDNIASNNVTFVLDGAASEAGTAADGTTVLSTLAIAKGSATKIGGNGVLTEVYYDKDTSTAKITLINTYGGEVSSVRAATASKDANVTVTPQNAGRGGNYETDAFAVDDVVLYTYSNKTDDVGVQSAVKAEQITGTLTGYTGGKSVTVDSKTYEFNAAASISDDTLSGAVKNEVTLTLDKYGYVVDVDTEAASTNYAVVLKYKAGDGWDNAKARLLFTDGTTKDVTLKENVSVAEADIVSYTVNNKDQYTLKKLAGKVSVSDHTSITTKGNSGLNGISGVTVANGKTIFLVATKNGDDTEYTAYTGIANVPTIKTNGGSADATAYVKSGSAATVVYIDATANTNIESSTKNVIFVMGSSTVGASYDAVKGTYYKYDAIVNGEITEIESANQITSKTMYTTIAKDKNGVVTLSGNDGVTSGLGTDREANGAIGLNGSYYSYAKDCQVFFVDTEDNISTSSIGGISKDATNNVWFKMTDGDVTTIVIQDAVSGAKQLTAVKTVAVKASDSSTLTVTETGTVNEGAKTFSGSVSGTPVNGDKIVFTPVVSAGASANEVTATFNGSAWIFSGPIVVTAEDGTTATYTGA